MELFRNSKQSCSISKNLMTKMKCFFEIAKNSFEFIEDSTIIPRIRAGTSGFGMIKLDPKIYLKKNVYKILSDLGKLNSYIFLQDPFADKKSIHMDINPKTLTPSCPCLNICFEGQGVMRWYKPTRDSHNRPYYTADKSGIVWARSWTPEEYGEIIDEWHFNKSVAICRVDVAHQVYNEHPEVRLTASIRWDTPYTFEETINFFKNSFNIL